MANLTQGQVFSIREITALHAKDSAYDGSDQPYNVIAGLAASLSNSREFFFKKGDSFFSWGPQWQDGRRLNVDAIYRAIYSGRIEVV